MDSFPQIKMQNFYSSPIPCALDKCDNYGAGLDESVYRLIHAAKMPLKPGMKVLVKPNLLTAKSLACTNPKVITALCKLLLQTGCKVEVADSPGFGRAKAVARAIGLDTELASIGLDVLPMDKAVPLHLDMSGTAFPVKPVLMVSRRALECDYIISLPRIKAHSQMRITLAVKNLFGCVCGARKAIVHAKEGRNPDCFAACLAALWAALPPAGAFVDGIIAMNGTGPSKGTPYKLGLLGACASAQAMDRALLATLGISMDKSPLAMAIEQRTDRPEIKESLSYPLLCPEDFQCTGFETPGQLAHTSFSPGRLFKSICRRLWAAARA